MWRTLFLLGLSLLVVPTALAQEAEPTSITVTIRGVITETDAQHLREALRAVEGITFEKDDIQRGEKGQFGHYFSPAFVIEIADLNQVDIGALATIVAETKTPSREEVPPSLNLVLFDPDGLIDEPEVVALRQAMRNVNGVEPNVPGGIGGVLQEGRLWIRLEGAGGANLPFIQEALVEANLNLKLTKP